MITISPPLYNFPAARKVHLHDSALKIGIKTILHPEASEANLGDTDNPPSTIPSEIQDTTAGRLD